MHDLTPIPTAYNGHLFRSRLEARWAVFFDTLGWRYDYESEGFDLDGAWYLPDFWLPDLDCWVEIKPPSDGVDEKALLLAAESRKRVLVVRGNPWPGEYGVFVYDWKFFVWDVSWRWALSDTDPHEVWLISENVGFFALNPNNDTRSFPNPSKPGVQDALLAARSARFEHGESGRTL
jgi:hypothetical protein